MGGSHEARGRVVTPAVAAAAAFALLSAIVSVAFVSARGGLELPVAATAGPGVAIASPSTVPLPTTPQPTPAATPVPVTTPAPSEVAGPSSAPEPTTPAPTPGPSPGPSGPPDPLAALPGCPGHPGCYEYTVRRGDSYTAINDRFGLLLWITDALNPEIGDKGVIVIGQTLYLGRDPEARLDPCPDLEACRLYRVSAGDTLSGIASRYHLSSVAILALNPRLDPGHIFSGEIIKLPLYQG